MSNLYKKFIRPAMFGLDAESAHEIGVQSLRFGLSTELAQRAAARRYATEPFGVIERFGLKFASPLGVAAGFDKNGVVVNQLASVGFGFVEVGTVTCERQKGNEKPRLFRLPADGALINRLGFNNDGARVVAERLRRLRRQCVVGVNIGKNKDVPNEEAVENYLACFDIVHEVADYIAINVSSPNTPNLRELQRGENLEVLISALSERNHVLSPVSTTRSSDHVADEASAPLLKPGAELDPATPSIPAEAGTQNPKPLLVKIAPDLSQGDIEEIVDICMRLSVSGIIATNTTVSRQGLDSGTVDAIGSGGLSGRPLTARSNEVIRTIYRSSHCKLPIIGVGGIFSAEDAFEKIAAGASLLQAYTGFVYSGPSFARDINSGLIRILKANGFSNIDEAVGSGA